MFLLRRRWTLLTAFLAVIGYIVRNYDIQGIENIHIEPRDPSAQVEPFPLPWRFPENAAPYSGVSNPYPDSTANVRPSTAPIAFPSTLPGTSPSSFPNVSTIPIPSPIPGTTPTALPMTYPGTDFNPGQQISLGEKFAVWEASQLSSNGGASAGSPTLSSNSLSRDNQTLRVASFNVQGFGSAKRAKPHVMEMLVKLLRSFDVVALQEICSNQDDLLPELVERLNQSGRRFDYVIGPRVGRGASREQFAFLFDTDRIETDRYQLYTVDDPQDLLFYEPLVGWFRTKGVPVSEAFTFSLINTHSHPDFAQQENQSLPDLIRAIEHDGRSEDDWIFAGDFGAGDSQLAFLQTGGARLALLGVPTDTRGLQMLDNLIFSNQATREFTGRAGVIDFLRQFNLSLEHALELSDHLPIWAEFSIHEGGLPGQVAPQVAPATLTQRPLPVVPPALPSVQFDAR